MPPHLFIATPCFGGMVSQSYMQSVCALMAVAAAEGVGLTLALLGQDALITRSRNTLLARFRENETASHILFVDADIGFAPADALRLLRAGKDLAAALYPLKQHYWDESCAARLRAGEAVDSAGLHYVGQLEAEPALRREGSLATARTAGTGFMLVSRNAVERLCAAFPQTRYRGTDSYTSGDRPPLFAHALFECAIDPDTGTYLSEDFAFCRRWRDIGGEIWLDTAISLTHTGPAEFRGHPERRC